MSREPAKRDEMVERIFRSMIESNQTPPIAYAHQLVQAEAIVAKILGEDEAECLRPNKTVTGTKRPPVVKQSDPMPKKDEPPGVLVDRLAAWLLTAPGGVDLHEYRLMGQDGVLYTWDGEYMDRVGIETCALAAIEHYVEDRDKRDGPGPRSYYYVGAFSHQASKPIKTHTVDG